MKNYSREELKQLLKKYKVEVISAELGIPMKQLEEIKNDNKPKNKSQMQKMREKYKELYLEGSSDTDKKVVAIKEQSKEESELIDSVIGYIKAVVSQMYNGTKNERRRATVLIMSKLEKIKSYDLNLNQAEALITMLNGKQFVNISLSNRDKIEGILKVYKKDLYIKLAKNLDIEQEKTQDIQELRKMLNKLPISMTQSNLIIGTVYTKITNKINKIQKQEAMKRVNTVSENIEKILQDLSQGKLDIQEANKIIDEEAKKRMQNKTRKKFALTQEQQREQVLMQIKIAYRNQPEKYCVQNPEKMLEQMQELYNDNTTNQSLVVIIDNLISTKKFEEAKSILRKYYGVNKNNIEYINIYRKINNAEISDLVLKALKTEGTIQQEEQYFETIKQGIEKREIKLSQISLGKSKNGLKTITLEDIWEKEQEYNKD